MKIRYGLLAFEFIILAFFALPVLSKILNPEMLLVCLYVLF